MHPSPTPDGPAASDRSAVRPDAPGPERLPVRRIRFEYRAGVDPAWNRRRPEFACAANGVSLLMPYAEPYFVASISDALGDLSDDLRPKVQDYLVQERRHHREHRRLNDIIGRRYPRVVPLERWMERTYGWLAAHGSRRFNLAFAAGSETIAFTIARWTEDHLSELFTGADPVPATLFLWHLAEEVEHKSVAFDVYAEIDGSRLRYAGALALSLVLLGWFTVLATLVMLAGQRRLVHPAGQLRLLRWAVSYAFSGLPVMVASALPGHHPSDLADPVWLSAWLGHYDPETATLPAPSVLAADS